PDSTFSKTGTGGAVNAVVELIPAVRVIGNAYFSSGGGRYIANTNLPNFIVNSASSMPLFDSFSWLIGSEIQAAGKTSLFAYYSAAHADSAVATDVDGSAIGFGVPGSTTANEDIVEATAGFIHTFFR